ncbi:MAG: hypothetical protein K2G23_02200 [Muribaculaceae bacterium]|nr:hypothetical protein [Muribaculaceae bacterium]
MINILKSNRNQIIGYGHYLLMKAQLAGNMRFDGHMPSRDQIEITRQCRSFCESVAKHVASFPIRDLPYILEYYELCYRIGYQQPPKGDFLSCNRERVFKAWVENRAAVEESALMGMMAAESRTNKEKFTKEYAKTYKTIMKDWVVTLKKFDTFPNVTSYENYQRLALIMRENLDRYLGEDSAEAKKRWYEKNKVEDTSLLGTYLLRSYRQFVNSLFPDVLDYDELIELDSRIIEELSLRRDLDPYDHQAFTQLLEFNKIMAE